MPCGAGHEGVDLLGRTDMAGHNLNAPQAREAAGRQLQGTMNAMKGAKIERRFSMADAGA